MCFVLRTLMLLSAVVLADDTSRFSSEEFAFRKNYPIFGFDMEGFNSSSKALVFFAAVKAIHSDTLSVGVALSTDDVRTLPIEAFGVDENVFIRRAVLDGKNALYRPSVSEEQQVTIKGKVWNLSLDAKAIVVRLEGARFSHLCRLEVKPVDRLFEENAPVRNLFCKPVRPIKVQMIDSNGRFTFDEKGNPEMIDTVVCPLPRDCIKPEWEIVPSIRFIPDVDDSTVHADTATSAVVHTGTRPAAK